jgi:hypothetical protein
MRYLATLNLGIVRAVSAEGIELDIENGEAPEQTLPLASLPLDQAVYVGDQILFAEPYGAAGMPVVIRLFGAPGRQLRTTLGTSVDGRDFVCVDLEPSE